MSKRVANRRAPSRNKGVANRRLKQAIHRGLEKQYNERQAQVTSVASEVIQPRKEKQSGFFKRFFSRA